MAKKSKKEMIKVQEEHVSKRTAKVALKPRMTLKMPIGSNIIQVFILEEEKKAEFLFIADNNQNEQVERTFLYIDREPSYPKDPIIPRPHIQRFGRFIFEIEVPFYDLYQEYLGINKVKPLRKEDGMPTPEFQAFIDSKKKTK